MNKNEEYDFLIQDKLNSEVNQKWDIPLEVEIKSDRKFLGGVFVLVKKTVRKIFGWYVLHLLEKQKDFNYQVAKVTNKFNEFSHTSYENSLRMRESLERQNKGLEEIERKFERLNRELEAVRKLKIDFYYALNQLKATILESNEPNNEIERTVSEGNTKVERVELPVFDYYKFEERFRGSREDISKRQEFYLEYFLNSNPVLDIGCGRGEFLELLQRNEVEVIGIDTSSEMVEFCKERGLPVVKSDAFTYLKGIEDDYFGGIFMAQVVEHLSHKELMKIMLEMYRCLKPGGVVAMETINVKSVYAMTNWFYLDPTHVKPVHPDMIAFFAESIGFRDLQIEYLSPVTVPQIPPLNVEGDNVKEFNLAMNEVNNLLYSPQDFAIICRK